MMDGLPELPRRQANVTALLFFSLRSNGQASIYEYGLSNEENRGDLQGGLRGYGLSCNVETQ